MLNGYEPADAFMKVLANTLTNAGVAFLGGGLSGGVSTVLGGVSGTTMNSLRLNDIANTYSDAHSMYKDIANSVNADSKLGSMAKAYADRLQNGDKISAMERGFFANAMDEYNYVHGQNEQEDETEEAKKTSVPTEDVQVEAVEQADNVNARVDNVNEDIDNVNEEVDDTYTEFKNAIKPIYGTEGQKAYDKVVRSNANFSDDVETFSRIYNAGRYGNELKDAGDFSRFGNEYSSEVFKAGVKDAETEYNAFAKPVKQFVENPTSVKHGAFINATARTSDETRAVMKKFVEKVPFSVMVIDSRDGMSHANALLQLKEHGLVDQKATVESVFNTGSTGVSDPKRGFVVIDINSDNFLNTLGHELTHIAKIYNPEGYQAYKNAVLNTDSTVAFWSTSPFSLS